MSKTVGQQLRQAREARSHSLTQVAQTTRIKVHYLKALEEGNFEALPSQAQARGFLRAYAGYLNLDAGALLAGLNQAGQTQQISPVSPAEPTPETEIPEHAATGDKRRPASDQTKTVRIRPTESARPGDSSFIEVGQRLQNQRELLGITLDEVERHTRLKKHYLRALEMGASDELPSPVQGRGMLKNYAAFLGLDPDPLLLVYADGLQKRLQERHAERFKSHPAAQHTVPKPPGKLRWLFSGDLLIGGSLGIFLLAFVLWSASRIYSMRSDQTPTPTAPSIVEFLLAPPSPTTSPIPAPVTPTNPPVTLELPSLVQATNLTPGAAGQPGNSQSVQIYITVRQRSWMRVVVDGKVQFDGRVIPGSAYTFTGQSLVEIVTGNGASLQVFFNQQDLGLLGAFGQVVSRLFSPQGIITATPTITLTPTATPRPSATPVPTRTLRPGEATEAPFP